MEPITSAIVAIKVCTAAVKNVHSLLEQGAELHQCSKSIAAFFSAKNDISRMEKEAQNPPLWKKIAGADTAKSIEIVMQRKRSQELMSDLHRMLKMAYGPDIWQEVIAEQRAMEAERDRQYFRRKRILKIWIEGTLTVIAVLLSVGLICLFAWISFSKEK
ncbi:MAG TPA: hypothetical protein DCL39_06610 [Alteromonas macleodii]|nr:hypothetical protein [Alteromonas macleodii]HAM17049.1 hypothetical protein [Alteromonas macleodii]|tara:strand:- start:9402 stop:9881 length:480 start_codon:yes stop_codon:yes gene_type:complete